MLTLTTLGGPKCMTYDSKVTELDQNVKEERNDFFWRSRI